MKIEDVTVSRPFVTKPLNVGDYQRYKTVDGSIVFEFHRNIHYGRPGEPDLSLDPEPDTDTEMGAHVAIAIRVRPHGKLVQIISMNQKASPPGSDGQGGWILPHDGLCVTTVTVSGVQAVASSIPDDYSPELCSVHLFTDEQWIEEQGNGTKH